MDGDSVVFPAVCHVDGRIYAFFIIVAVTLVFIESERAIGSRIDFQFESVPRLFGGKLNIRTYRYYTAGSCEDRNGLDSDRIFDSLTALIFLTAIEIIPVRARR